MSLISAFIQMAADGTGSTIQQASLAAGGKDIAAARATEAVAAGYFPIEVACIVLGCLILTGFALLARESRIEKRADI